MISLCRQIQLLFAHKLDSDGKPLHVAQVAEATGISQHTLFNVLHGHQDNPRLNTLLRLCHFFGITMDYFDLQTEQQCLSYLAQEGKLGIAPDVLREIDVQSRALTPRRAADVLAMLQWRLRGFG